MHELSIIQGVLDIIEKEQQKHKFKKVLMIEVVCGQYNCLCEETMNFCFETAAKSTCAEGASFKVKRLPEVLKCLSCGREFEGDTPEEESACPFCGSETTMAISNHDMYLSRLEVE